MSERVEERSVMDDLELKKIVGQVAAAYFGNSHVTPSEIGTVISQIASSIAAVGAAAPAAASEPAESTKLSTAQIRRSITPNAIISFEDHKPYKTLRRHLASRGMTPEEYRGKWGLPSDYPMVAPSYSEARSQLAKSHGLGGRSRTITAERPAQAEPALAGPAATTEAESALDAGRPQSRRGRPAAARVAAQAASAPAVSAPGEGDVASKPGRKPARRPPGRPRKTRGSTAGS